MATYETAQDQYVQVGDIRFAYRQIGPSEGVPLVLLMHFRGTMDHWDPALINPLAAARPVILVDNAGVGRSGGQVPETFHSWAQHYLDFLVRGLGVSHFDVAGFSMGGMVAQLLALNAPSAGVDVIVRSLLLLGTMPSVGDGVTHGDRAAYNKLREAASQEEQRVAFLATLFDGSTTSQSAGQAAWDRIVGARRDRVAHVGPEGTKRQGAALANFMDPSKAADGSYNRFEELRMPVLIADGSNDLLVSTDNSILMWNMLKGRKAQLHLFPDSGHGFLFQYSEQLSKIINNFLDASSRV